MGLFKESVALLGAHTPIDSPFPHFTTDDVEIGENVTFGDNVIFNCDRVRIGDGCKIGDNVRVDADVFEIGDYGTIYEDCFFPGPGEIRIGHNLWLGKGAILDANGGTTIGNNVAFGAQSQLWTHAIFGDVMAGNRFVKVQEVNIGDDVWFVGHCLVSPITAEPRSIAMLGSVVTGDMEKNHAYAGVPAEDITEKVGGQFDPTLPEERVVYLEEEFEKFAKARESKSVLDQFEIVTSRDEMIQNDDVTYFNVTDRTYTKRNTNDEHKLMWYLLPDAKFVPLDDEGWLFDENYDNPL